MSANHSNPILLAGLLVADPVRREGLAAICAAIDNLQTVYGGFNDLVANEDLRFLFVDLGSQPGTACERAELVRLVRKMRPDLLQIALGPEEEDLVQEAILAGARAYLDFSSVPLAIHKAFQEVLEGTIWTRRIYLSKIIDRLLQEKNNHDSADRSVSRKLTAREKQVLDLILQANSNREIAKALGIEERTVKAHLGHLMNKAKVTNRVELSIWAIKQEKELQTSESKKNTQTVV